MLTDRARVWTRGIVEPIVDLLVRIGLTPNAVTVIGTLLHLLVAWLLAEGRFVGGALMLFVAAGVDGLDGTLARKTGRASPTGAFLDSSLDRISEILTFLGLLIYADRVARGAMSPGLDPMFGALAVFLALAGSLMVSYTRARSEGIGRPTKAGILGRMERMAILVIGLFTGWVTYALWIIAIGAWITTGMRIYDVLRRDAPVGGASDGAGPG